LNVEFSPQAQQQLQKITEKRPHFAHFSRFIRDVIQQDPRPAYQQGKPSERIYGIVLHEYNIRWKLKSGTLDEVEVLDIADWR
ncbi:tRNA (N6-threonylcarbamoyladenosine(37)-N6)-methyltransferase TrmO, partial [[Pasteurella] aerogenes]